MNVPRMRIAHNHMHPWHLRVEEATSTAGVVADVQHFIASLTPADLSRLPESCRPQVEDASDVDFWSLRLAEACKRLWGTDQDGEVLIEVAQIFHRAAVQISRIAEDTDPRLDNN